MAALSKISAFLKNAWAKEPVITVSVAIGILAAVAPLLSPYTKYSGMINRATPYVYPGEGFWPCCPRGAWPPPR
uniref:NADH dehydrogenase [ubiquinone] 1 alpha subcomplex subunit 3 n=1 Tax=Terrapene triunguis TaxID=2587831 RepID=A0A674J044_9SAUR